MKNKAVTRLLKQIAQALASMTKAKSLALNLKSKMSDIKTKATIFSLLYLGKGSLLGSIRPNKFQTFLSHHRSKLQQEPSYGVEDDYQISNQAHKPLSCSNRIVQAVQHAAMANHVNNKCLEEVTGSAEQEEKKEEEDLIQALLEEMVFEDPQDAGKSAIELVTNSDKEEEGEDFRLEDRIDEVAELFINRIHHQMRMQKQDSFNS